MPLLTVREVADRLNITERLVRELLYRGELPKVKVGRLVRISEESVEQYVQRRTVPAA
jgi:excisionase family DNA binding protein